MDLGLKGKVALITGAGRGIGADTARFLADEGMRVVVVDMDQRAAQDVAFSIRSSGGEALGVHCDVTSAEQVKRALREVAEAYMGVDVLVNNAGLVRDSSLLKMAEEDWDLVMDVTLKGAFHFSRAVIPHMREHKWGRIMNIASRSIFGNPGQTNYSAAKAGVVGFTRALSLEQAAHGITVNAIAPGFIETDGMQSIPNYSKLRDAAQQKNPVGFLGAPRDVAATVAFLASQHARYISGTTMFVTGGRYSS
jgi:3-oxoacyl-[acyl-carrier protein] reductase